MYIYSWFAVFIGRVFFYYCVYATTMLPHSKITWQKCGEIEREWKKVIHVLIQRYNYVYQALCSATNTQRRCFEFHPNMHMHTRTSHHLMKAFYLWKVSFAGTFFCSYSAHLTYENWLDLRAHSSECCSLNIFLFGTLLYFVILLFKPKKKDTKNIPPIMSQRETQRR